jgi:hypothetical protein
MRVTLEPDIFYFVVPSTFQAGKEGNFFFTMVSSEQVSLLESQNTQETTKGVSIQELDDATAEEMPDWEAESKGMRKTENDDHAVKLKEATVLKASAAWTSAVQWGAKDHDKQYEERRLCEVVEKKQKSDPKAMFEDPEFPAKATSMYHTGQPYAGKSTRQW